MRTEQHHHDVVVVGGGLAGTSAAIAAARNGRSVALLQNRPVLGGNSSSEVRVWVCGATATGHQRYARETGIVGEFYLENEYRNPLGNPQYWDLVLLEAVKNEPNIDLFLNTHVLDVHLDGQRIESVRGHVLGSERELHMHARFVIDCTGDGSIAAAAGADHLLGREGQHEYSESWAPAEKDDLTLGSTLLFYTREESEPVPFIPPSFAIDVQATSILESRVIRTGDNGADYWWIEWGGELDVVHDNERIRDELWGVIYGIWDYIKNSGKFDAENLTLEWVGSVPGKREYRRVLGETIMTQMDIEQDRRKPDAIGFGGWSIDLHPPKGVYEPRGAAQQIYPPGLYDIPFSALYSRNIRNLLVAGRNVSATHVAFGSMRVMATCGVMGEAAGTAAALCAEQGIDPTDLSESVTTLQQRLIRHDASLIGVPWTDPADRGRGALVTASSSLDPDGARVVDGSVRLDADTAVLFPRTSAARVARVCLSAKQRTSVQYAFHTTADPLTYTPRELLSSGTVDIEDSESRWHSLELPSARDDEENLVLVLSANDDVSWHTHPDYLFGQLAMRRRADLATRDIDLHVDDRAPNEIVQWDIKALNRTPLALRIDDGGPYAPSQVISAYSRPFAGPQIWSSAPMTSEPEWLELRWDVPQSIEEVHLLFNDDVNEYANNLHYSRWPFRVIPEIVADYDLEVYCDGAWYTCVVERGNRRRHRVHACSAQDVEAIRVKVLATNGSPYAQVVAVRVF
ncbi:FAD-dependent oxidoreductase [Pseudactinotalea sp. Z1739]|uniref:FAD-dependent oxidoreductase n=1 Tax=Pseudactinotalea sp. Z1739 TaxID=3413028 RepID=UPI003C79B6D1